ncbi:hypothetical protein [Streptomyces sp. NPDC001070]
MQMPEVEKAVEAGGGFALVAMVHLRNAAGWARAKEHVVEDVSEQLRAAGYGHLPRILPKNQDRPVLVYRLANGQPTTPEASGGNATGRSVLQLVDTIMRDEDWQQRDQAVVALASLLGAVSGTFAEVMANPVRPELS